MNFINCQLVHLISFCSPDMDRIYDRILVCNSTASKFGHLHFQQSHTLQCIFLLEPEIIIE